MTYVSVDASAVRDAIGGRVVLLALGEVDQQRQQQRGEYPNDRYDDQQLIAEADRIRNDAIAIVKKKKAEAAAAAGGKKS